MDPIIANGNHIIRYNHVGFKIIDYGVVMHEYVFEENLVMLGCDYYVCSEKTVRELVLVSIMTPPRHKKKSYREDLSYPEKTLFWRFSNNGEDALI